MGKKDAAGNPILVGDWVFHSWGGGPVTEVGEYVRVYIGPGTTQGPYEKWEGVEAFLPSQITVCMRRCGYPPTINGCSNPNCPLRTTP